MKNNTIKKLYEKRIASGKKYSFGRTLNPASFLSPSNKKKNMGKEISSSYIGCQGGGGEADGLRFGALDMAVNGCEVISVYNVLKFAGKQRDIREIALDFERRGAIVAGAFGVKPDAMFSYLRNVAGMNAKIYGRRDAKKYDELLGVPIPEGEDPHKKRAAILTYWNGPGKWTIHSVAIFRLPNGRIRIFNRYTNRLFTDYDSVAEFLREGIINPVPLSFIVPEI